MPPRSDVRPLVRKALVARFNAHQTHAFAAGIGGRFAYAKAVQGWALPYAAFFFVGADPEDSWSERGDEVTIQISVWAKTAGQAEDLASAAFDLFESQTMSLAGIADFELYRSGIVPTMDESDETTVIWQAGIELAGLVQTIS